MVGRKIWWANKLGGPNFTLGGPVSGKALVGLPLPIWSPHILMDISLLQGSSVNLLNVFLPFVIYLIQITNYVCTLNLFSTLGFTVVYKVMHSFSAVKLNNIGIAIVKQVYTQLWYWFNFSCAYIKFKYI